MCQAAWTIEPSRVGQAAFFVPDGAYRPATLYRRRHHVASATFGGQGERGTRLEPEAKNALAPDALHGRRADDPAMNTNSTYVVETEGLTKRFGARVAVNGVDLRIPAGSAFGYLGPNGAGKTTLIRMLLGLTSVSSGEVSILGHSMPSGRAEALARVGAIVEEPRFHRYLTGRQNMEIVAAAREPEAHRRIDGALARVGLGKRADEKVSAYSLGMRQRLGVARALLGDPELLILDEPMNGLDPAGMEEFRFMIRGLVEEGRTVVLSSHLLDEVEKTCDAIAIVDQGRVVVQGSIDELTGDAPTVLVATADDLRAQALLAGYGAEPTDGGLRVRIGDDATAASINRRLVESGLDVHRLEPERVTLERRFLDITSRLEAAA
jgi:ABC-2 type transport system ATP-binding protein